MYQLPLQLCKKGVFFFSSVQPFTALFLHPVVASVIIWSSHIIHGYNKWWSVIIYSSHNTHVYKMQCPLSLSILHTLHIHTTGSGLSLSILHTLHMYTTDSGMSLSSLHALHMYTCRGLCLYLFFTPYTCIYVVSSVIIYSSHTTHVHNISCPLSLSILHTLHMHTTCRGLCHNLFFTHYTCIQHFMSSVTIYSSSSTHVL